MATLSRGKTFGATEEVTNTKLHALIDDGSISDIQQSDLAASNGLVITSASAPSDTDALWRDSGNSNVIKYYTGSAWATISPTTIIPPQYRNGLEVTRSGAETISVDIGDLEVNGSILQKTSTTTLALGTASDWAGGVSLQATSTYGYVGVDADGLIKLHTTAPAYSNYALTNTNGIKRYASWSSVAYRIIGWFYMNATGSGEINTYEISNIKDMSVSNTIFRRDTTADTVNDTTYGSDLTGASAHFYCSGGYVETYFEGSGTNSGAIAALGLILDVDASDDSASEVFVGQDNSSYETLAVCRYAKEFTEGTHLFTMQAKVDAASWAVNKKKFIVTEF